MGGVGGGISIQKCQIFGEQTVNFAFYLRELRLSGRLGLELGCPDLFMRRNGAGHSNALI